MGPLITAIQIQNLRWSCTGLVIFTWNSPQRKDRLEAHAHTLHAPPEADVTREVVTDEKKNRLLVKLTRGNAVLVFQGRLMMDRAE